MLCLTHAHMYMHFKPGHSTSKTLSHLILQKKSKYKTLAMIVWCICNTGGAMLTPDKWGHFVLFLWCQYQNMERAQPWKDIALMQMKRHLDSTQ